MLYLPLLFCVYPATVETKLREHVKMAVGYWDPEKKA